MDRIVSALLSARRRPARFGLLVAGFVAFAAASRLGATSIVPISDPELYRRADVVVHGIVTSSDVTVDSLGRPETVSIIEPLAVLKGRLAGSLVLHQLGGTLPDGRFFKMWGRPEYQEGREVVVFAIARSGGEYETAEMLLGKFEVNRDEANTAFAVPELATGSHPGVDVLGDKAEVSDADGERKLHPAARLAAPSDGAVTVESAVAPRSLAPFLASLRRGVFPSAAAAAPVGKLTPVEHVFRTSRVIRPLWGNISNVLYRWNNLASATWTIAGTANMDGGGLAEAQGALDTWTSESHSNINYISGSGSSNVINMNATVSVLGCGWSTCLSGAGVIGCGGPSGAGGNTWRGDSYNTIVGGTVELRAYCSHNLYGSVTTEAVLQHELGHTLGLGHSDQNASAHDVCRGDEDAATMRSVVQNRASLGTDDIDSVRWLYGDGFNSCTAAARGDFDGDGKSDLVWRHSASGATSLWLMNGTSVASAVSLPLVSDTGWRIVGSADFNGDGTTDLVWRHSVSGASAIWLMNGTAISSVVSLPLVSDTNWKIVATGDFNADGKTDIVWRHDGTGASAIWLMNGTALSSNVSLPGVSDTNWKIVGAGDFNADGKPDLVWRHSVSGANSVWYMNGTTLSSTVFLPSIADSNWRLCGVADYNGDGKPDLVWRHVVQGLNGIWLMNGVSISSSVSLPLVTDTGWEIVGPR